MRGLLIRMYTGLSSPPPCAIQIETQIRPKPTPQASLGVYDAVILAFPDTALAHYGRGVVLRKLQRPEEACNAMSKVLLVRV